MTTASLNNIELNELTAVNDAKQHCKATFPLIGAHGSKQLATVYFEIEPGDNLGSHTDSAEELLVILDGHLEATIGQEKGEVRKGEIVLVPEMVPHDFKNIGSTKARILGVFGGVNNIVATFDKDWLPLHTNVVDTAQL
ncbi:MAG: cupin domain-containing protein [Bacteroidetes bacterium]|nr:cupin domain-containing protein [Bacteroidota bacterium]